MADGTQKMTLNQWFLLLLGTIGFGVSGFRQYQQQAWAEVAAMFLAWLLLVYLIRRHRANATAVLGQDLVSLQPRLSITENTLRIDDEVWPLETVREVEMGIIDQKRAYVYFTFIQTNDGLDSAKVVRKYLFPYADFDSIKPQLMDGIPHARWLLP
jgi:hypothetical protein